jgi:hypothetical protein
MLVIGGGLPRYVIETFAGKVLDVPAARPDDGLKIQQWDINGSQAQAWYIDPCGADEYRIVAACSGRVLDVAGDGTAGSQLVQWPWTGNGNQRWRLRRAVGNTYTIESTRAGLVIDVRGASRENGAPIVVWSPRDSENQRFRVYQMCKGRQLDWAA